MPRTKHPQARLQKINDLFVRETSHQSVLRFDDLMRRLDISERQLRIDFDELKTLGAPLEYDRVLRGWRYRPGEPFALVDGLGLTGEDLTVLRIAVETLSKVNHVKDFMDLPHIFEKIYRAARKWTITDNRVEGKAIYFDPFPTYNGSKHLHFFLEAIDRFSRVEFLYQPFHEGGARQVQFDPYFVRHYDRRWYIGGKPYHTGEDFVRVFPMERIINEPKNIGFFHDKPPTYDAESYWKHIYGITVPPGGVVETVELEFTALQGKYFESSPFYSPYEVVKRTKAQLVVRMQLIPNIDLVQKIASYGAQVQVLAPESLRTQMKEYLQEAATAYKPIQ
jgi:predicted DNA-binding transcriptional regulator YafY